MVVAVGLVVATLGDRITGSVHAARDLRSFLQTTNARTVDSIRDLKQTQYHQRIGVLSKTSSGQINPALDRMPTDVQRVASTSSVHRSLKGMGSSKSKGKGKDKEKKGKGKGKGDSKKCNKSKGKGMSGMGMSKSDDCVELPAICEKFDFSLSQGQLPSFGEYNAVTPYSYGYGYRQRALSYQSASPPSHRELQFDGALCDPNIFQTISQIPSLSIFTGLLKEAGLDEIFLCAGPFTILPPSNDAFAANPGLTNYLANSKNKDDLLEVLLYHIIPGLYLSSDFKFGLVQTLQGETITVTPQPLEFNGAGVSSGDILACSGVVHIIDEILTPPGKFQKALC